MYQDTFLKAGELVLIFHTGKNDLKEYFVNLLFQASQEGINMFKRKFKLYEEN